MISYKDKETISTKGYRYTTRTKQKQYPPKDNDILQGQTKQYPPNDNDILQGQTKTTSTKG
jgi:hypothetical protein